MKNLLLILLCVLSSLVNAQTPKRTATEKLLGKADPSTNKRYEPTFWVSPDGRRAAWLSGKGIVVDGELKEYEYGIEPKTVVFSPDSQRVAYVAKVKGSGGRNQVLVLDGVEGKTAYSHLGHRLHFSPDSKHIATFARLSASSFDQTLLIDGRESDERFAEATWELTFTHDSKKVVYGVKQGDHYVMREQSIDGSEPRVERQHGPYKLTDNYFYGPAGQVGYIAKADDKQFVIYDGKDDGQRFKEIRSREIVFSADGKQIAYAGEPQSFREAVVFQGQPGKMVDLQEGSLAISPDGRRHAYAHKDFSKRYMLIDGKDSKVYRSLGQPVFSPDSARLAFAAVGENAKGVFLVVDGKEGPAYDEMGLPLFSHDSKSVIVWAKLGQRHFVLVNGQPQVNGKAQKAYDDISSPVLSPDGKRLVYLGKSAGKWVCVDNGVEQTAYDELYGRVRFSPDSSRIALLASSGDHDLVVVDGTEGKKYDLILTQGGGVHFDSPDRFHYLAMLGEQLYFVEETLEP